MRLFSTTDAVNFVSQMMVNRAVNAAFTAGVNSVLVPVQIALDVGIAVAAAAATFLIMTTAKLAIAGAAYVGEKTYNGVTYYFYQPQPANGASQAKDPKDLTSTRSEWELIEDSP